MKKNVKKIVAMSCIMAVSLSGMRLGGTENRLKAAQITITDKFGKDNIVEENSEEHARLVLNNIIGEFKDQIFSILHKYYLANERINNELTNQYSPNAKNTYDYNRNLCNNAKNILNKDMKYKNSVGCSEADVLEVQKEAEQCCNYLNQINTVFVKDESAFLMKSLRGETISAEESEEAKKRTSISSDLSNAKNDLTEFKASYQKKLENVLNILKASQLETQKPVETSTVAPTVPATEAPATETPATEAPATEAPATETPATEAPATEAPATETPATETPATETPATETPATETPATETPATETPATETPATETPATETPATETPATETPATEIPATETPAKTVSIILDGNGGAFSVGKRIIWKCEPGQTIIISKIDLPKRAGYQFSGFKSEIGNITYNQETGNYSYVVPENDDVIKAQWTEISKKTPTPTIEVTTTPLKTEEPHQTEQPEVTVQPTTEVTINPVITDNPVVTEKPEIQLLLISTKKIGVGESFKLDAKSNASGVFMYRTSDNSIASVDSFGKVKAKKAGTAIITVSINGIEKTCTVFVKKAPTKKTFRLSATKKVIKKGKKYKVKVSLLNNCYCSKITYSSSNKKVASVNSKGVITAKKKGKTRIVVKASTGVKKYIQIIVK